MKELLAILALILFTCLSLVAQDHHHVDPNEKLGVIAFPISCSKTAQTTVEHGLALLHSFLFDDAETQFHAAVTEEPTCAMAYWAGAIGLYPPLAYRPTDPDMEQGWEMIQKAQTLGPKTQRERDYLDALAVFYRSDDRDYDTRNRQYSAALEKVYKDYPTDQEAAVFYALSLLA